MFPHLTPAEIERLRRFGEPRSYRAGECLARTGEVAPGMFVILRGEVAVTPARRARHASSRSSPTRPGSFMGELAQLSGRPVAGRRASR